MGNVWVVKVYKQKQYQRLGKWEKEIKPLGSGHEMMNKLAGPISAWHKNTFISTK